MAVHDMRTPLTTIFLQTSTLLFKSRMESDRWSLDVINVEARRLDSFIDDLLILIKKDKDNLRLSLSEVRLGNMVREAIQESELLADAANVKFELILPSEDKNVSLDANLIRRVLDNLLSNAIKQSPIGGRVEVSVSFPTTAEFDETALAPTPGPQGVRLMVSDCGQGIPPEYREKIFDMVEIVNLKQHGISNTGIGLAFCKMVIDQHSGNIFVAENQTKGSVFVVDL
jgi:signal transduction histidine kinase